jgi:RNA polymerase sigma-70 factor (ECF subfamily)
LVQQDAEAAVLALVARLPPGDQAVLQLYFFVDLSHKDIADLLGIAEGTSKSRSCRALNKLREMIRREGLPYPYK